MWHRWWKELLFWWDYGIPIQTEVNELCRALSRKYNIPLVITNDCRYIKPQDTLTLDILNCISKRTNRPSRSIRVDTDQQYLSRKRKCENYFLLQVKMVTSNLSDEELVIHGKDMTTLDITVEIAERCNFKFKPIPTGSLRLTPHPDKERPDGIKMNDQNYWADTQAANIFSCLSNPSTWNPLFKRYPSPLRCWIDVCILSGIVKRAQNTSSKDRSKWMLDWGRTKQKKKLRANQIIKDYWGVWFWDEHH